MKIILINSNVGGGGPGGIVKDLYSFLHENGDNCFVAFGRKSNYKPYQSIHIGNKLSLLYHYIISKFFDNAGFLSTIATKNLIRKIIEFQPDIINLHNLLGYYINIDVLLKELNRLNIPVVWTIHDSWAFTGHCINPQYLSCEKWKNLCDKCPMKSEYPQSYLLDNSRRNYFRKKNIFKNISNLSIISPSIWLSELANQSILSKFDVRVIHNGIDLNIFRPTESNIKEEYGIIEKKILLFVAKYWYDMKGIKHIYRLSKMLSDDFKIVMIGENKDRNIPNSILAIEKTEDQLELIKWYSAADVFINPSLGDNFPTVNLESLACGTPVITYDTGGSSESINELCGIVIKKGDIDALFRAIVEKKYSNFKGVDCIKQANRFDKYKKYKEYRDLFNIILKADLN